MLDIYYEDRSKCVRIVERLSLFKSFAAEQIREVARKYNHFFSFDKGEVIIEEDSPADCYYVLLSGEVGIYKNDVDGVITFLKPGEVFGEMAMLANRSRTCNVVAESEQTITIKVKYEDFSDLKSSVREMIRDHMIDSMAQRLVSSEPEELDSDEFDFLKTTICEKREAVIEELTKRLRTVEEENTNLRERIDYLESTDDLQRSKIVGLRDPYEVLGVSPGADFEEVHMAYRILVKKYNPHIVETLADDVRKMVGQSCKEINIAYAALKKKFKK